jgi:hypothetical protein
MVSGQLPASLVLPLGKEPPIPIVEGAGYLLLKKRNHFVETY